MRAVAATLLAAVGCGVLTGGEVVTVQGAAEDTPLAVTLTRRFSVGGEKDTALPLRMLFPKDVGADDLGHLFVLSGDERAVAIYDSTGRQLRKVGRRGKGPGELEFPLGISVEAGGGFYVKDISKKALVGFFMSGRAKPEVPLSMGAIQHFAADREGKEIVALSVRGNLAALRVFGREGGADTLAQMALAAQRPLDATKCGLAPDGHTASPVFAPGLLWAHRSGRIAYVSSDSFAVRLVVPYGARTLLSRKRAPDRSTEAAAMRALPQGWRISVGGKNWCTIPAAEALKQIGYQPTIPAYEDLAIDNEDRVWALRTTLGSDPRQADLYDYNSGYIGTIILGSVRPVTFLSNGDLVSLERDSLDVPVVAVYRVKGLPARRR
jgi:hypothetical protein